VPVSPDTGEPPDAPPEELPEAVPDEAFDPELEEVLDAPPEASPVDDPVMPASLATPLSPEPVLPEVLPSELLPLPPSEGSNASPVSKQPRSGALPAYGNPTFVPLSMSLLVAASLRKGRTGRLPSACLALAIPPNVVMSVGKTQGVPPAAYGAGHDAGGANATL
jgi:hypothetical protein